MRLCVSAPVPRVLQESHYSLDEVVSNTRSSELSVALPERNPTQQEEAASYRKPK